MEWQFKISNGVDNAPEGSWIHLTGYQIEHIKVMEMEFPQLVLQSNQPY